MREEEATVGGTPVAKSASSSETEEGLKSVLQFWEQFDLDGKRMKLDQQGLQMANNQEKSVRSRKKLAEETKEFRKITQHELKCKKIGPLLKSYQDEIDRLTRRARYSEAGFLDLYKSLYEAPDPVSHLHNLNRIKSNNLRLEYELEKTKKELAEYESEFSELKNQEITIRELEDQIAVLQAELQSKSAMEEEEKTIHMKVDEVEERERERLLELERENQELQEQIMEYQNLYDEAQEQLFELRSSFEDREAARDAELEIAEEDQSRNESLDIQLQQLKQELEQKAYIQSKDATSSKEKRNMDRNRVLELEDELSEKRKINDDLEREIGVLKAEIGTLKGGFDAQTGLLQQRLDAANSEIETLKHELSERPSKTAFDELNKQLRLVQALEFNVDTSSIEIEGIALQKVRKLEATVTNLKLEISSHEKKLHKVEQENQEYQDRISDDSKLIKKLEDELAQINTRNKKEIALSNNMREQITETSILKSALSQHDVVGEDSSMLSIVHEQRNRFRQRMLELESERDSLSAKCLRYQQQLKTLRGDNVKLYEKIKYLQNFASSVDKTTRLNSNQMSEIKLNVRNDMQVEQRYKDLYEDQINPFSDFNSRERKKRIQDLNSVERITLRASNFFLANRVTRSFLFFYFIALHLLVFLMLMMNTHTGYNKCTRFNSVAQLETDNLPPNVAMHASQAANNA